MQVHDTLTLSELRDMCPRLTSADVLDLLCLFSIRHLDLRIVPVLGQRYIVKRIA